MPCIECSLRIAEWCPICACESWQGPC